MSANKPDEKDEKAAPKAVTQKVATVKMYRQQPQHPGGPLTADVHPDEVAGYQAGGWSTDAPKPADKGK